MVDPIVTLALGLAAAYANYGERAVDEVEWQGGRMYLHLGARRDDHWAADRGRP